MTLSEFSSCVNRFRRGACPGRNLYLYCGRSDTLLNAIGNESVHQISVFDLPGVDVKTSVDEIRQMLVAGLNQWFTALNTNSPRCSIAVLHDLALFAAYNLGIDSVYARHASDRRMTVFCAPRSPVPPTDLLPLFDYEPLLIQRYFRQLVSPDYIVEDFNGTVRY